MRRRRTKRISGRRGATYTIVIILLLIANHLYRNNPSPDSQPTEQIEANKPTEEATKVAEEESHVVAKADIWAELPREREDEDLYYTSHTSAEGRNFTVCYSAQHCSPLWVAAPKHPSYRGEAKRTDNYAYDPTLPVNIQPLLKRSYGEYTRGHMLGSAERTASREMNDQAFYSTNIAPQIQKGFNAMGGAWNNVEAFVEKQICSDTLYVVTGAIYDTFTDSDGTVIEPRTTINKSDQKRVGVPTAYYKAMLRTKSGDTGRSVSECRQEELKCAAIIVGHRSASGRKPSTKELISIDELERLTGFDFFTYVPHAPEAEAKAADWNL